MKIFDELLIYFYTLLGGYKLNWGSKELVLHPYDRDLWTLVAQNTWEPKTLTWLKQNLHKDSIFFDVGAWIGPTAIWAHLCGAKVVAFEPDPFAYERLLFNINKNGLNEIFTIHAGLAPQNGNFLISSARGLGRSMSRMNFSNSSVDPKKSVLVSGIDLETSMKISGVTHIDLLKMDIEGGEFHVFPAVAPKLVGKVKKIMLSLHGKALSDEEFRALSSGLIESTKLFSKLTDIHGNNWEWNAARMDEFKNSFTEIVLS